MKWLDKLERKMGRFAIQRPVRYLIFAKALVFIIGLIFPDIYEFLYLTPEKVIFEHQFWRLISFVFIPSYIDFTGVVWLLISFYFYWFISTMLENSWGTFRLNLYLLIGYLTAVGGSFLFGVPATDQYVLDCLFLAYAVLYPNMQVLLFFFLPIRVKWIGIFEGVMLLLNVGLAFSAGYWQDGCYILLCMLPFILFFLPALIELAKSAGRQEKFQTKIRNAGPYVSPSAGKVVGDKPFHRCCVCGLTDLDDPSMTFRYCSDCAGSYEYCANHLHNHEHKHE